MGICKECKEELREPPKKKFRKKCDRCGDSVFCEKCGKEHENPYVNCELNLEKPKTFWRSLW